MGGRVLKSAWQEHSQELRSICSVGFPFCLPQIKAPSILDGSDHLIEARKIESD